MDTTRIKEYKALLKLITIPQKVTFHQEVSSQIEAFILQVNGTAPAFGAYKEAFLSLDERFNQRLKSIETDAMVIKAGKRDGTSGLIVKSIHYHSKFPKDEAEAEAVRILKFEIDDCKDISRKNYTAETAYLRKLITCLRRHPDELALFGLTPLIDRLELENNDFEELFTIRAIAIEERSKRGPLTRYAVKVNKAFDIFCRIIGGLSLMPLDAATLNAVNQIIFIINAQIHQFKTVYNRHAGVALRKRKKTA